MSWGPWRAPTEPKLTAVEPRHPRKRLLIRGNPLERMTGIEPALSAWEADVLPLNYIRVTRRFTLRCVPSYPTRDLRNDLRTFGATCVRVTQAHAMESCDGGQPWKAPHCTKAAHVRRGSPAMCGLWSARCCRRGLHADRLSGRFSTPTGVLGVPGPDAPLGTITYLLTTTESFADSPSGSDWRMVQLLNLGRTAVGANYRQ
jgi:hypothetical protein